MQRNRLQSVSTIYNTTQHNFVAIIKEKRRKNISVVVMMNERVYKCLHHLDHKLRNLYFETGCKDALTFRHLASCL